MEQQVGDRKVPEQRQPEITSQVAWVQARPMSEEVRDQGKCTAVRQASKTILEQQLLDSRLVLRRAEADWRLDSPRKVGEGGASSRHNNVSR